MFALFPQFTNCELLFYCNNVAEVIAHINNMGPYFMRKSVEAGNISPPAQICACRGFQRKHVKVDVQIQSTAKTLIVGIIPAASAKDKLMSFFSIKNKADIPIKLANDG